MNFSDHRCMTFRQFLKSSKLGHSTDFICYHPFAQSVCQKCNIFVWMKFEHLSHFLVTEGQRTNLFWGNKWTHCYPHWVTAGTFVFQILLLKICQFYIVHTNATVCIMWIIAMNWWMGFFFFFCTRYDKGFTSVRKRNVILTFILLTSPDIGEIKSHLCSNLFILYL